MESLKRRLRGLITRECISKGMNFSCVQLGVERGEYLLETRYSIPGGVREGVAVAAGQLKLANFRKRSFSDHVA